MKLRPIAIALVAAGWIAAVAGQEPETPAARPRVVTGRSKIATKFGIVAASQPLAARAGVQILERGGNADRRGHRDQRGRWASSSRTTTASAAISSRSTTKRRPASSTG